MGGGRGGGWGGDVERKGLWDKVGGGGEEFTRPLRVFRFFIFHLGGKMSREAAAAFSTALQRPLLGEPDYRGPPSAGLLVLLAGMFDFVFCFFRKLS